MDPLLIDACDVIIKQWFDTPSFRTPSFHRLLSTKFVPPTVSITSSPDASSSSSADSITTDIKSTPPAPTIETRRKIIPKPATPKAPCGHVTLSRNHCVHVVIQSPTSSLKENEEINSPFATSTLTNSSSSSTSLSPRRSQQITSNNTFNSSSTKISTRPSAALTQPYKAESNHRDYSTKASMDRARQFIQSLKRVESIVNTSMMSSNSKERTKQAHKILSGLDTNHTGILDRRTFSLACRRLQLGLSRTDIDALIAFLRSRKFAGILVSNNSNNDNSTAFDNNTTKRRALNTGCIRWRWFLIQFCGAKYNSTPTEAPNNNNNNNNNNINNNNNNNNNNNTFKNKVNHDYNRVINNHLLTSKNKNKLHQQQQLHHQQLRQQQRQQKQQQQRRHTRPRTADTLKKARSRMQQKQKQRPVSSGARDQRGSRRRSNQPQHRQHPLMNNNHNHNKKNKNIKSSNQQRPSSVPYKRRGGNNNSNNLASMASAMQNGSDWTFFGGERKSHKDIANMMLRKPSSPKISKHRKRASPLLTARLRPFFGTVYNQSESNDF